MSFVGELKRRNVFRVGAAYVVASWLLIQVAETLFPLFGFDDNLTRNVVIALAIGLIPALIAAWVYEFTPEGLKKEKDVDRSQTITDATVYFASSSYYARDVHKNEKYIGTIFGACHCCQLGLCARI